MSNVNVHFWSFCRVCAGWGFTEARECEFHGRPPRAVLAWPLVREPYTGPLPTVGDTRREGISSLRVTCGNAACVWSAYFDFDTLKLPEEMIFVQVPCFRRFVCSRCGGRAVSVMPDWRQYAASGNGKSPLQWEPPRLPEFAKMHVWDASALSKRRL